jgi:hypothetical protein
VHEDREDASVKATGKWKAALATTVAAASSVAMATGASANSSKIWNDADVHVDQDSTVKTHQFSLSNSGLNHASSWVVGVNYADQLADGSAGDGNITNAGDDGNNTAGNLGAPATNDNTGTNDGDSSASIKTGKAKADNYSETKVSQNNDGGANAWTGAHGATISGGGGIHNSADLDVYQDSYVKTEQAAVANSGLNAAKSGVIGANIGVQTAYGQATGGDISNAGDRGTNVAGNSAGSASNTNAGSNTGKSSAYVQTGDASASNSSKTNVSQNNSGSAKASTDAEGATISGWNDHSDWGGHSD